MLGCNSSEMCLNSLGSLMLLQVIPSPHSYQPPNLIGSPSQTWVKLLIGLSFGALSGVSELGHIFPGDVDTLAISYPKLKGLERGASHVPKQQVLTAK